MDPISQLLAMFSGGADTTLPHEALTTATPGAAPGAAKPGAADILGALKAPQVPKPQLSGGVSGVQLPYRTAITDLISPAFAAARPQAAPSLGTLFAQMKGR